MTEQDTAAPAKGKLGMAGGALKPLMPVVAVVCGLAGGYLVALALVILGFRRYLKRQPKPFSGTLSELRQDRECIRAEN